VQSEYRLDFITNVILELCERKNEGQSYLVITIIKIKNIIMEKPIKKPGKKDVTPDKKVTAPKPDKNKGQKEDKNYRPQGSDEQIGDGSAGMGGTSAI